MFGRQLENIGRTQHAHSLAAIKDHQGAHLPSEDLESILNRVIDV